MYFECSWVCFLSLSLSLSLYLSIYLSIYLLPLSQYVPSSLSISNWGISVVELVALGPQITTTRVRICAWAYLQGVFIFDFDSLPLEVARPIQTIMCTKVAVKHQSPLSNFYPSLPLSISTSLFMYLPFSLTLSLSQVCMFCLYLKRHW